MELTLFIVLCGVATAFYALWRRLTPPHEDVEPPVLWPKMPLVGHVIGMFQHGTSYYSMLRCILPASLHMMPRE